MNDDYFFDVIYCGQIESIMNTGKVDEKISNACFWIAICDYLKYVLNINNIIVEQLMVNFGVISILNLASDKMMDLTNQKHIDIINRLQEEYKLQIHFFHLVKFWCKNKNNNALFSVDIGYREMDFSQCSYKILKNPQYTNHVCIKSSGAHYELLLALTGGKYIPKNFDINQEGTAIA